MPSVIKWGVCACGWTEQNNDQNNSQNAGTTAGELAVSQSRSGAEALRAFHFCEPSNSLHKRTAIEESH